MSNAMPIILMAIAIFMLIGTVFAVILDRVKYNSGSFPQIFLVWCILVMVIEVILTVMFSINPDKSAVGDFTVAFADAVSALMLYVSLAVIFEDNRYYHINSKK